MKTRMGTSLIGAGRLVLGLAVLGGIDSEVAGQCSFEVTQIIEGQADERLDDFLSIVQASDLSALSNTLTPELVTFIRGMLV